MSDERGDYGPEPCQCGRPAEPGSEECYACRHGMPPQPRGYSLLKGDPRRPDGCRGYLGVTGDIRCQRGVTGVSQCAFCAQREREAAPKRAAALDRRLLRERARGYGPATDGEDVFRGFRGEE